ncbi:MAG: ferritin-like domain-containing protein [Gemmatimonadaceae bacterium]
MTPTRRVAKETTDMQNTETILGAIDPEVAERLVTRREAIRQGASVSSTVAAGLAMASVPVALAALSKDAFAQTTTTVQDVLNFALMLEIFENEFYKAVLGTSSSTAQNTAFTTVRALVPAAARTSLGQIQKHEAQHVAFLLSAGAVNVLNLTADSFDFTGGRGAAPGPFLAATTDVAFLLLTAQAAEDTGVRAYKGQAPNLVSNTAVLENALRIHSVEARHAAKIRRMRRLLAGAPSTVRFSGTVSGGDASAAGATGTPPQAAVAALGLVYGAGTDAANFPNEANTTQGGIAIGNLPNLPTGFSTNSATEAFDEPLSRNDVRTIVQPFFKVTIP